MRAEVVVDLQFGSTAKGKVCAHLARSQPFDASVRVQSIQAGHTIYQGGKQFKMRTIPCAWVDPGVRLILGAGCFIEKKLLLEEIEMIESAGYKIRDRLYLDYRANYVMPEDFLSEDKNNLTKKIGSTSEGAGASLIRKIWRKDKPTRVVDDSWAGENGLNVFDSISWMNSGDMRILVEGCQGTLLSVHTSPYYPFCTSRECTVAGIISEAGISPFDVVEVHGVFRTYPIRVGGNSGDTGGKELSWEDIRNLSQNPDLKPETTTVTGRERRIFEFSDFDFQHSIWLNKPTKYYLAFMDYVNHIDYGVDRWDNLSARSRTWICSLEKRFDIKIGWVSTGEKPHHIIDLY